MISKNSFWANCRENHKRRIWVWIIAIVGQLMSYVGILTVYLSRIRSWYVQGNMYLTYEDYHNAMCRATAEAMGFQEYFLMPVIGLAFIIGIQGFSYLHDRRKVDLYHSVPVDKNRRFLMVWLNGIMIYLTSTIVSILVGVVVAVVQDAVNGQTMAVISLAFAWNLLFFLVIYHTVILAVMLTGNRLITICVAGMFMLYELILYGLNENMKNMYFKTYSTYFVGHATKLSAVDDYFMNTFELQREKDMQVVVDRVLPYYGKWIILALVLLAVSWFCYRKRPSEASGRAIAFVKTEPILKVLTVIPASAGLGVIIRSASYGNTFVTLAGMVAVGVIACAAAEVIYDFDIKSLFKHPFSSGVTVAGIIIVFFIFNNDLLGYDKYVPLESEVDSAVIYLSNYEEFWKEDFTHLSSTDYMKAHMFLTDVEPVLTLASKCRQERIEDMSDPRTVYVMYRLKSGREVGRKFWIDYDNPANEELLNRIVGSKEYREGAFQIMTDRDSFDQVQAISYSNGATGVALPPEDAQELRDAYIKDMEKFDFSLARHKRPCGRIEILLSNARSVRLNVYESFENTIACLQSGGAYYSVLLNPADIESISVVNHHYRPAEPKSYDNPADYNLAMGEGASYGTTVSATFYDEEQFAQIVPVIYPTDLQELWHNDSVDIDSNYDIHVTFKKDTTYPYLRNEFNVSYLFFAGQVPDFVEAATAIQK